MVNMDDIAQIKRLMRESGMTYLSMTSPEVSLTLVMAEHAESDRQDADVPADAVAVPARVVAAAQGDVVRARQVGVFQHRHVTRKQPALAAGAAVVAGETLGFVRDGLVLYPVIAERAGIIAEIVPPEQGVVGYGAALFVYRH